MHRCRPCSRRAVRAVLVALFASLFVLSAAPDAWAQMGASGGGSSGGGGGTKAPREKKPKPKRNEQAPVDPAAARTKLQQALETSLPRGNAAAPYLANLFDQASTGTVPASAQARKALAEALATGLKGKKLEPAAATALAEPLAAFVNAQDVTPEDRAARKDPLKDALAAAGMTDEQVTATLAAVDRLVADQQSEAIKKVMEDLENIQKEGTAGDDNKKSLAANVTALAAGDAKPSEVSVLKLAEDVSKGLDAAQLTNKEKAQLAYNFRAAVSTANMPPAELMPLVNEVKSILKAGLVKQVDVNTIAADLQAVNKSIGTAAPAPPESPDAPAVPEAPAGGAAAGEGPG